MVPFMTKLRTLSLSALCLFSSLALSTFAFAQAGDVFTVSVLPPAKAADANVLYAVQGDFGTRASLWASHDQENRFNVPMQVNGQPASSLKAAVFSPFCQLATVEVKDLNRDPRSSEFQCQGLSKVSLHGHLPMAALKQQKNLEVEVMYVTWWSSKFFNVGDAGVFQLDIAKAPVQPDGSFTVNVPNFAADPLWSTLTNDAGLLFAVNDKKTGKRITIVNAPETISKEGRLKVAATYPSQVEFALPTAGE
jgi:hypothetical protein